MEIDLDKFIGKRVKIIAINEEEIICTIIFKDEDYDNEDGIESIDIREDDGSESCLSKNEIKSIEEL